MRLTRAIRVWKHGSVGVVQRLFRIAGLGIAEVRSLEGAGYRRGAWVEVGLAIVSAVLAVATLAWLQWIEAIFGADPNAGSGGAEWAVVAGLLLLSVVLGVLAGSGLRHPASEVRQAEGEP